MPGTTTLNSNGEAELNSISCAAAGECSAGGYYSGTGGQQAFVLSETNGSWGTAIKVPGAAALNDGGWASVDSISCAAVGECAAGGTYVDGDANLQVFVVDETNGSWASAIEVPGTAKLNTGGDAQVYEVSCGAARDCAAGGFYNPAGRSRPVDRAFVANETNGIWGKAAILKGVPAVCVVPDVLGKALHVATKRIHAAGCRVGTFTYVYSKLKKGRVVSQRPRCDKVVVVRTRVALAVSKGRRAQASLPGARRDAPPFPSC